MMLAALALILPLFQDSAPPPVEKGPTESSKAYEDLAAELRSLAPKGTEEWQQKFSAYIALVKEKLEAFAKKYPGTEEGYDARFQLADVALEIDKDLAKGVQTLQEIARDAAGEVGREDLQAKALFLIGRAQIDSHQYGEAKKNLLALREAFPSSPYAQAAEDSILEIETLAKLAPGQPPIHFEVADLDGNIVSPRSFEGKVLLLDFWATWCPPCRQELPHLKETYAAYQDQGFRILGISLDKQGQAEKLKKFLQDEKMTWPQFYDGKFWQNEIAKLYGIQSIPATFLVDRKGKIRYKNLRGEELKKRVAELVAEKS